MSKKEDEPEAMNLTEYCSKLEKTYGDDISIGATAHETVSTGVLALDLALGGGVPRRRFSLFWGPESSGKTTIAMKTAAEFQKYDWETGEYLNVTTPTPVVFIDAECAFDPQWAGKNGVDDNPEYFRIIRPSYGEMVVDILYDLIVSSSVGFIIVDSLEALIPKAYDEKSAEDSSSLGDRAKMLSAGYRKWTSALIKATANNKETPWKIPTLLCLNQVREKVGISYGSPNVLPGGLAQRFYSHTIVSLNKAKVADNENKLYGTGEYHGIVEKSKGTAPKKRFAFEMSLQDSLDQKAGFVDNPKTLFKILKNSDGFTKLEKGGWDIFGQQYKTQDEFRDRLYKEPLFYKSVVEIVMNQGEVNEG